MKKLILPVIIITLLGASCNAPEQISFDNAIDDSNKTESTEPKENTMIDKNEVDGPGFITAENDEIKSDKVGEIIKVSKPSGLPSTRVETGSSSKEGPIALIRTTFGTIRIQLFEEAAPGTVKNFIELANAGFYEGTIFHRVIKGFMIQGGDPLTREQRENNDIHGTGGPGYAFADEISDHSNTRGFISMANSGPNTNGSQFFILTGDYPQLDGRHAVFGEVFRSMGVVDRIESIDVDVNKGDHPYEDLEIIEIEIQR